MQGRDAPTNFPHEHYSERWAELTGGMALDALAAELRAEKRVQRVDAEQSGPKRAFKHAPSRFTYALRLPSCPRPAWKPHTLTLLGRADPLCVLSLDLT